MSIDHDYPMFYTHTAQHSVCQKRKLPHFAQVLSPTESYMTATQTCVMKAEPEEVPLYSGKSKGFAVQ